MAPVDTCSDAGQTELLVLSKITFPREEDGVTPGFDLDGSVSEVGGATGCGVADQVAPDGTPGIDSSFARLLPALDQTEAVALPLTVQEAINSGGLLVMVQLDDVDDPVEDACVDLTVTAGVGQPMVGSDGFILPSQTFDRDLEAEESIVEGVQIVAGAIEDGPVDLALPFQFLDADAVFNVYDGRMRLERGLDGRYTGRVGGGVPIAEISALAHNTGIGEAVEQLLDGMLGFNADLAPDDNGVCQHISVTLEFEAVQAFFFED